MKFEKTRIVHENELDINSIRRLNAIIRKFLFDFDSSFGNEGLQELRIEIRIMNKEGNRTEFEVKSDLFCDNGIYASKNVGWSFYQTIKKSIKAIKNRLFY